jgi:hypothetical protein
MSRRRCSTTFVATLALALGLVGVDAVGASGAGTAPTGTGGEGEHVASELVGTWIGPKSGAEGGKYERRAWRVVFKSSKANAAIGTKQYRQPNGHWSKPEVVNAVVDSTGHIWAVDTDGLLNGSISDSGTLDLIYQEAGTTDAAAVIASLHRSS